MLATTRSREYLTRLLRYSTTARPPVGFVRNFVVEHSGENRGQLNLKAGGLVPIASLGRWIAIVFEYIYGLLLDHEITAIRDGAPAPTTWIAPRELDTLTRRYLREAFRAVAEVQTRLEGLWVSRLP